MLYVDCRAPRNFSLDFYLRESHRLSLFFCQCRRLHFKDKNRVETSLFENLLVHNSVEIPTKIVGFERNESLKILDPIQDKWLFVRKNETAQPF